MKFISLKSFPVLIILLLSLGSCINEYPKPETCLYTIRLNVHSDTQWLPEADMTYTRDGELQARYIFKIYQAGTTTHPVAEQTVWSDELSRPDFTVDFSLHIGSYDVYVWSDLGLSGSDQSLYYNASDFASIYYLKPYEADSNNKDAFRGATSFTVSFEKNYGKIVTEQINLSRPLARYMLVATDLQDFLGSGETGDEALQAANPNIFQDYTVRVTYPLFMPAVFNNFTNKPFESWADVSYDAVITPYSEGEVLIGLDYVMINGEDSNAQIAVEIMDDKGSLISSTGTINIPIKRDRTTIVYGNFLTASGDGDITLDPIFKGQYNIEYK